MSFRSVTLMLLTKIEALRVLKKVCANIQRRLKKYKKNRFPSQIRSVAPFPDLRHGSSLRFGLPVMALALDRWLRKLLIYDNIFLFIIQLAL